MEVCTAYTWRDCLPYSHMPRNIDHCPSDTSLMITRPSCTMQLNSSSPAFRFIKAFIVAKLKLAVQTDSRRGLVEVQGSIVWLLQGCDRPAPLVSKLPALNQQNAIIYSNLNAVMIQTFCSNSFMRYTLALACSSSITTFIKWPCLLQRGYLTG